MIYNSFLNESEEEKLKKIFRSVSVVHLRDEEFSDYLENKANLFTRMRVEAHLAQCDFCSDELQMLKELHQEDPGELDSALASQIKKRLAYIPVHIPAWAANPAREGGPSIFEVGYLGFHSVALGVQGKTGSDWAELSFSEDRQCAWTYREDNQRNLIFKFTVFLPDPKAVQLEAAGQTWEVSLKPEGDEWIAEAIISAQERTHFRSGDDIRIRVIK